MDDKVEFLSVNSFCCIPPRAIKKKFTYGLKKAKIAAMRTGELALKSPRRIPNE